MCWTNIRRVLITCSAVAVLLAAPSQSWAECALWEWLFGHGQTTYAPPYAPPNVCVPAAPACGCGCAPVQPACPTCPTCPTPPTCPTCVRAATYRISYRPVPTVAYMPVVGVDPCSGCAVTTYHPTRAWTYQASLVPYPTYQVGYATVAPCGGCAPGSSCSACGGCSSCGTPCGACSSCGTPCGGCSSCGTTYGGCSSCNAGVSGGYVTSGGCSSCAASPAPTAAPLLPTPSDMSRPPLVLAPSTTSPASPGPVTLGPPAAAPTQGLSEQPRTYAPSAGGAPVAPGAPAAVPSTSPSGTYYRGPTNTDGSRSIEPLKIQNIPPVPSGASGPQLTPTPDARPEIENRTTARPVLQATYFQLLPSPPAIVPAQTISTPVRPAPQPLDDSGWHHVDN